MNVLKRILKSVVFACILFTIVDSLASSTAFKGQISGWVNYADKNKSNETVFGLRYIPELSLLHKSKNGMSLDAEISANGYTQALFKSISNISNNTDINLYRLWVRYYKPQFEIRVGLQKINFGPAKLLRSLRWFDKIDPQDPLKLTDGVNAVLVRYYFLNNTNMWIWGLPGNDKLKGLEFVETDRDKSELGGRYQFSIPKGEFAVSYNTRKISHEKWSTRMATLPSNGWENRFAIDGNWDIGIGLWFESSIGEIKIDSNNQMWREFLTIGSDYTFSPGIYIMYEHFIQMSGSKIDTMRRDNNFSAVSLNYAMNVLDSVSVIGYYDWNQKDMYPFIGWQRKYDNWQFNLTAFSNKEDGSSTFSGDGMQFIVTYNH